MNEFNINGLWIYRSLINTPAEVDDFNKVKFGEGKLRLQEYSEGLISGTFDFGENYLLNVTGTFENSKIRLISKGITGTPTEGWVYEHKGEVAPSWTLGMDQRPAITGSVLRTVSHDGKPAGLVGSFIAVAAEAIVGKNIDPLPENVIKIMGDIMMRLHHTAWHAVRNSWGALNKKTQDSIAELGWEPPRPSLEFQNRKSKRVFTWTGAGEDFLFMHRQMVVTFKKAMTEAGVSWEPWITIPSPGSQNEPTIPPAWFDGDLEDSRRFAALKTDGFYWSRMKWWDQQFKDPVYLRTLTLGELGAEIEWSVHNDMHMRWSGLPRDPITNNANPTGRVSDDFDVKWSLPQYDDLADFYSSQVNPIFWKLHGWIDDRIDDWFLAHETFKKGSVKPIELGGVAWFEKSEWVQVEKPWVGGMHHSMSANDNPHMDMNGHIETMKKVITLTQHPLPDDGFLVATEMTTAPQLLKNVSRIGKLF